MLILIAVLVTLLPAVTPTPVILDTDIGDDIDDTWALCQLVASTKVSLKLVVTASDNTPEKTRLVAKILTAINRTDIPIGTGKKTSDEPLHQQAWLGDFSLKRYKGKVHEDGVQALIDALNASAEPVTLCVIGPQTNIAEALKRDPGIASKADIVMMAGSVYAGYEGKPGAVPEWNVMKDIAAAKAVFAAPWNITMAPLDVCGTLILKGADFEKVATAGTPMSTVIMENYDQWSNRAKYPAKESSVLFDTVAVHLATGHPYLETKTIKLRIDDAGRTVPDENGRPVECALAWKDKEKYLSSLATQLTK